jgi:hypothetical protein
LTLSKIITSGISAGSVYKFRVSAHNIHGWSTVSNTSMIYATDKPSKPAAVTTQEQTSAIVFSWTAPNSNFESIEAYKMLIQTSTSSFQEETTYCNAS